MKDGKEQLSVVIDWLLEETSRQKYAEIILKVTIHDGQIRRIEKGTIEKSQ